METSTVKPVSKGKIIKFLVSLTVWNSQPCGQEGGYGFLNDIHSAVGQLVNHFLCGFTWDDPVNKEISNSTEANFKGFPGPMA